MSTSSPSNQSIRTPRIAGALLGVALALQLVFSSVYWGLLWRRGGYETLPWIIGFSLLIALTRYRQHRTERWYWQTGPAAFFLTAIAAACNASLLVFADPWLLGAALVSLVMAVECSLRVEAGARGLAGMSLPWLALLLPVAGLDFRLDDLATQIAADWSNRVLTVGKVFHQYGEIVLREEDSVRRIILDYSLHSLMGYPFVAAVALMLAGWHRRRLFHLTLLLASTFFWVVFAKVMYLGAQAFAFQYLKMDAGSEWFEQGLSIALSLVTVMLVWSTDQFLAFWLGPVEPENLEGMPDGVRSVGRFWNRFLASYPYPGSNPRRRAKWNGYRAVTVLAILSVVLGAIGFFRMLAVESPAPIALPSMATNDFATDPALENAEFREFRRSSSSPSGQRQYTWIGYRDGLQYRFSVIESLGRVVDPHAELRTRFWRSVDGANEDRSSENETKEGPVQDPPLQTQTLEKPTGVKGTLLFRELGRDSALTTDLLGHFPRWSDDRLPEMFKSPRVYAKVFIFGYRAVEPKTLEWGAAQLDRLIQQIETGQSNQSTPSGSSDEETVSPATDQ